MEVLVTEHITAQHDPLTHGPLRFEGPLGFPRELVEKATRRALFPQKLTSKFQKVKIVKRMNLK